MILFDWHTAPVIQFSIARQNADQSSVRRESRVPFLMYLLTCAQQNVPPCETQSTPTPPQVFDCLVPDMQFMSKYALPVSQTKGMLKNMLTKDLTATVVWLNSAPWLDLVGLVGVGLVGVGFYILARVVSVGLWEWACGSGLVGQ